MLLLGILGAVLPEDLQVINGIKNALALVVNFVAAVTFLVVRPEAVDWAVVGLWRRFAARRRLRRAGGAALPPVVLRAVVACVGVVAIVRSARTEAGERGLMVERVERIDDARLADYVGLTDVALRSRREPELGLYLAESEKVIRRALDAGHRPRSLLMADRWLPPWPPWSSASGGRGPVFAGPRTCSSRSPASTCTAARSHRCTAQSCPT